MASTPSVLFMSCSDVELDDIIKLMPNVSESSHKLLMDDDISAFKWHIDNKYYTADVNLCPIYKKVIVNKKFADSVEATILHFDNSTKDVLEKIESWLPFINEFDPEIKILLCKNLPDNDNCNKKKILEWCVGKGFELVELEPIIDEDNASIEDEFTETTGMTRVIQALNAHVWPNLVMKTSTGPKVIKRVDSSQNNLKNLTMKLGLEESLEELIENDDDFSELFSQLSAMKERVMSLSGSERKDAAEQVVKAFWNALGGDPSEFSDM